MINKLLHKYRYILWVGLGFILLFYPLWTTGVMHNDELMVWFDREESYGTVLQKLLWNELGQGRVLRILAPINQSIGFLTPNMVVNRIIQSVLIIVSVFLGVYFIYKLVENKRTAVMAGIVFLSFLAYSFESSVPQAYVGITVIPVIELLLSAIIYMNYLRDKNCTKLIISIFMYIIALLGYEYMLTFILIFPILCLVKGKPMENKKHFIFQLFLYGGIGVLYIVAMFVFKILFPGNYEGTSIGFVSLKSSWDIISQIFKSSFPGYFLVSDKYRFLFQYYTGENFFAYLKELVCFEDVLSLRIILYGIWLVISFIMIEKKIENDNETFRLWPIIVFGGAYTILPILPNAVSTMYQGNVSEKGFVSLPVNYVVYLAIVFLISSILIKLRKRKQTKWLYYPIVGILILGGIAVQITNEVFMKQSSMDFERYTAIEQALKTDVMKEYANQEIYAPDLYETRNTLAIRDGYWSSYAKTKCGLNVEILREDNHCETKMFYVEDRYFCITNEEKTTVISKEKLIGPYLVQTNENTYDVYDFEKYTDEHSMYCYVFANNQQ